MTLSSHVTRDTSSLSPRFTAKNVHKLDMLPARFTTCSELFLSHNDISTIELIEQFRLLKRLMIEHNKIVYMQDLKPLGKLMNLEELRLEGNPICRWPLWDIFVINLCRNLKLLNGKRIKRHKDVSILTVEQRILNALYFLELANRIASGVNSLPKKTPQAVAKMIANEMSKLGKKEFQGQIRINSPTRDPDEYIEYLQKRVKKYSNLGSMLPPETASKYKTLFEQVLKCGDDVDLFAEAARMLAACSLQGIGLQSNDKITTALRQITGNDALKDGLELASVQSRNLFYQKPKLPVLNLQPDVYAPKLKIEECTEQETFERDYEPVLETIESFEFETKSRKDYHRKLTDEEVKQFHDNAGSSDEEDGKKGLNFDKLLKQEIMESESARLADSDYLSDGSFEQERKHGRREARDPYGAFTMSDTSTSPPSSARSRHDRRERRKNIQESISSARIQELSSQPNSLVIVKFFKMWQNNYKQKLNKRTRRNFLMGSLSGSLPPLSEEAPLSARDRRPVPIPMLPNHGGMKFFMGDPIGSMLSDSPRRRTRSNSSKA